MKLLKPLLGRLTQGVIFTCGKAENYDGCHVHGLVVTARCDVEQQKAPLLSYLPIVALDAWLEVDGYELLLSRATAECFGKWRALLDSVGLSRSLLDAHSPRGIYEVIFEPETAEAKFIRSRKRALELVERFEFLTGAATSRQPKQLFETSRALAQSLLRELATQKLTGFYFLPGIDTEVHSSGYIVLLRQLSYLPRALAKAVAAGLESTSSVLQNTNWQSCLSFEHETFAMPLSEIASPDIEHVLQSFSMLYGRIGVEDLPTAYLDKIVQRVPMESSP